MKATLLLLILCAAARTGGAAPPPTETRSVDDMEDVTDWGFATSEDTKLLRSETTKRAGTSALVFATKVNHHGGEEKYPVGWPRTYKALKKHGLTDWSEWDFFEGWVYTESSRDSLPGNPLSLGLYHSGPKEASRFALNEVRLGEWTKFAIPVSRIRKPKDVQRVQFNISESDYRHGDQIDFTFDELVLTRPAHPAFAALSANRRVLFSDEGRIDIEYQLLGFRSTAAVRVRVDAGPAGRPPVARAERTAARTGVLAIRWPAEHAQVGTWTVRATLVDSGERTLDRKETDFRVIRGPFDEE